MKKITTIIVLSTLLFSTICLTSCNRECEHKNMTSSQVSSTCTEAGKTVYTCPDCNFTYNDDIIPPKGHIFTENVVLPTCEKAGYTEYTCQCGYSYISDQTSAKGHDFQKIVNAPECEKAGDTLYICRSCDYVYSSDSVKPLGHTFKTVVIPPTCTESGHTLYSCTECSFEYISDTVAPTGHKLSEEITPPTCLEDGSTLFSCSVCDYKFISDIVPKKDHAFVEEVLREVNCTEPGEIKYSCECGETYSAIVAPEGHDFSRSVTMPTLSDMGFTEFSCKNCSFKYKGEYRFHSALFNGAYAENSEPLAVGIDVSQHNHQTNEKDEFLPIDWTSIAKSGIDYVILKAGSTLRENGTKGGVEVTFEEDYSAAREAGLDVGVYFYTYSRSVEEIRIDAYMLLSALDGKKFEYPIYLDLEDDSLRDLDKTLLSEMCVEFFTILQRAGYYTGLYVNHEWLNNVIDTSVALSKFDIWYARYNSEKSDVWNSEKFGDPLGMWQYTDSGVLDAFGDKAVDMNIAFKDYPSIIIEGGYNGYDSDVNFADDHLEFVWISANSLTVRSTPIFEGTENVLGYVTFGERFVVLEKNEDYTKIIYNGKEAYISANTKYISFSPVW